MSSDQPDKYGGHGVSPQQRVHTLYAITGPKASWRLRPCAAGPELLRLRSMGAVAIFRYCPCVKVVVEAGLAAVEL